MVLLGVSGCLMTADESRWHDLGRETSSPDVAVADTGADAPPDATVPDATPPDTTPPDTTRPDLSCPTLQLDVSGPADDGYFYGTDLKVNGASTNELWIGSWGEIEWGYFRFALSQPVAKGAVIVGAKLSLYGLAADGWDPSLHALDVFVEKSADAPVVTTAADLPFTSTGRPMASAMARWPATGGLTWNTQAYNTSPELAALIQEVVDSQGGLAAGSHLQIWVKGSQLAQADLATPDYTASGYSSHPARLTLRYCQ